jgi:hypothetical protein
VHGVFPITEMMMKTMMMMLGRYLYCWQTKERGRSEENKRLLLRNTQQQSTRYCLDSIAWSAVTGSQTHVTMDNKNSDDESAAELLATIFHMIERAIYRTRTYLSLDIVCIVVV